MGKQRLDTKTQVLAECAGMYNSPVTYLFSHGCLIGLTPEWNSMRSAQSKTGNLYSYIGNLMRWVELRVPCL